jgi:heme A synthase
MSAAMPPSASPGFARFATGTLIYMILVILWGAFVRHTGSGAGCGSHWPTCNGVVIPRPESVETLIEFSHRVTSGLALLLTVALVIWSNRAFAAGHPARLASRCALLFTLISAAIGAMFVTMGWVEDDNSVGRAVSLTIHLGNTLLLVGALALAAWFGAGRPRWEWRGQGAVGLAMLASLAAAMFVSMSGAVTSLGDTLFPVSSPSEAVREALSPTAHFLVQLRIFHPIIAMVSSVIIVAASMLAATLRPGRATRAWATAAVVLVVVQMMIGLLAVALRAPTWIALVHLGLADLLWISIVLTAASALATGAERVNLAGKRRAPESALGST